MTAPVQAGGPVSRCGPRRRTHHRSAMVGPQAIVLVPIRRPSPMKPVRLSLPILVLSALAACAGADNYAPKAEPSFYRDLGQPGAQLDTAAAASMISGYRANNGLSAVTLDPELTRLAQAQADVMAKRDKLDHSAGKPFVARLKASGYDAQSVS